MGKPSQPAASPDADMVSLHTQHGHRFYDNDAPELPVPEQSDDLPPLYTEAAESSTAPLLSDPSIPPTFTPSANGTPGLHTFRRDESISYYLDTRLDNDPEFLESTVRTWAAIPPRPFVRVHGYHRERRRGHDGKKEHKNITDFDIRVELTPYVYPDSSASRTNSELRTVENGERVKRGTVLRKRAPGSKKGDDDLGRIELGMSKKPTLTQWCHMYCASHSGLKAFQLRRQLIGFDEERVRDHLDGLVRGTNYRGKLQITFPVQNETIEVWNDCRTNQWRLTTWIYGLFCVTMLWLLTWPYLLLRTKRFETVSAVWFYSRLDGDGRKVYTTLSEDQWYNLWGRALAKAVLMKRQGTLDQQDLIAAEGAPTTFNTGNSVVDGSLSVLAAGVNAMNEVNRQLGWGDDEF